MAAKEHILIDQSEIIQRYMQGKNPVRANLVRDNIQRFTFEHYDEKILLFFKKPSERIIITTNRGLFTLTRSMVGDANFDRYKEMLEEYSKKYHIGIARK